MNAAVSVNHRRQSREAVELVTLRFPADVARRLRSLATRSQFATEEAYAAAAVCAVVSDAEGTSFTDMTPDVNRVIALNCGGQKS